MEGTLSHAGCCAAHIWKEQRAGAGVVTAFSAFKKAIACDREQIKGHAA